MYFLFALSVETFETVGISVIKFWVTCLVSNIEGRRRAKTSHLPYWIFKTLKTSQAEKNFFKKNLADIEHFHSVPGD